MKILVAYYSRTGHTERLAKEIAARCHGDLEQIRDASGDRRGPLGYLRSGWQAARGSAPAISRTTLNPGNYDLVVIGTPVWSWNLSAPVRSYAQRHAGQFKEVAFFCTEGGAGEQKVFAELQRLCRLPPRATLAVKESELAAGAYAERLSHFVEQLTWQEARRAA